MATKHIHDAATYTAATRILSGCLDMTPAAFDATGAAAGVPTGLPAQSDIDSAATSNEATVHVPARSRGPRPCSRISTPTAREITMPGEAAACRIAQPP